MMTPTEGFQQTPVSHVVQIGDGSQGRVRSWGGDGRKTKRWGSGMEMHMVDAMATSVHPWLFF